MQGWRKALHEAPAAALFVALQHSSFHRADVLCRLLCTSRAMQNVIFQYCAGQMPLCLKFADPPVWRRHCLVQLPADFEVSDTSTVQQMERWIARNGQLLKHLTCEEMVYGNGCKLHDMMTDSLADSLYTAASEGPLHLQSFKMWCNIDAGQILQQFSARFLTQLHLHWNVVGKASTQHVLEGLSHLTGLRKLTMQPQWSQKPQGHGHEDDHLRNTDELSCLLMPTLMLLTRLTYLSFWTGEIKDLELLKALPQQLQVLHLQLARNYPNQIQGHSFTPTSDHGPLLQLQHLTELTYLTTGPNFEVISMDVLPANLKIFGGNCLSFQPLLSMKNLEQLHMRDCCTSDTELIRLSQLASLAQISLEYSTFNGRSTVEDLDQVTPAWFMLPGLKTLSLEFLEPVVTASVVQGLKNISSLEVLEMQRISLSAEATIGLPAVFQQLTRLTELLLDHLTYGGYEDEAALVDCPPAIDLTLARSIASLPRLTKVSLAFLSVVDEAAALALSGATGLTYLDIERCNLTDAMVHMISGMTMLQDLGLLDENRLTGACVATIAQLTQLTSLVLSSSCIRTEDLQCLSSLHRLHYCALPGDTECWWISKTRESTSES